MHPFPVRPAVAQRVRHAPHGARIDGGTAIRRKNARYSAHEATPEPEPPDALDTIRPSAAARPKIPERRASAERPKPKQTKVFCVFFSKKKTLP
jgi:hypothetical protein